MHARQDTWNQTGLSQIGIHCAGKDSILGDGTPLDDRDDVPMPVTPQKCFPGLSDKRPKTHLEVLKNPEPCPF